METTNLNIRTDKEVKAQAVTDSLTGLYNRRYFEEYIKKEAN